jgi:transcription elongation factor Elf1
MDISKIKMCEHIPNLNCPKCNAKNMKRTGTQHKEGKYLIGCFNCFYEEWVDPKDVQFTYEKPKETKKKETKQ